MTDLESHQASVREFLAQAPPVEPGAFERSRAASQKTDRSLGIMMAIIGAAGVLWQIWQAL